MSMGNITDALSVLRRHGLAALVSLREDACRVLSDQEGGPEVEVDFGLAAHDSDFHRRRLEPADAGFLVPWPTGKHGQWDAPLPDNWPEEVDNAVDLIRGVLERDPEFRHEIIRTFSRPPDSPRPREDVRDEAFASIRDAGAARERQSERESREKAIYAQERRTVPLIVTRHAGAVEWLRMRGIEGEVIEHATPGQVRGRHVYGILPLGLAVEASSVTAIDVPDLRPEDRGRDLSPEEMDAAGARLRTYVVLTGGEADTLATDAIHGGGAFPCRYSAR